METLLAVATILGGITALWFFWDKISAFVWREDKEKQININLAANPTLDNIEAAIINSDSVKDWNHEVDSVHSVTSYKHDLNLRFEISYMESDLQCSDFRAPWANKFPDSSATGYWCNLFYGSTLVEQFILVSVDGGRAMLPIPKKGIPNARPDKVLCLDFKVAQIHDTLSTLDDYMRRSGLKIYDKTG